MVESSGEWGAHMRLWGALPLTTCQDTKGGNGIGLAGLQGSMHTQVFVWKTLLVLHVQQGSRG